MTSEECVALIKRHFQCVWMEDDALPHDRERLWPAVERLTGMRHGPSSALRRAMCSGMRTMSGRCPACSSVAKTGIFKQFGDTLQRQHGADALDLWNDTLADWERAIEQLFGDQQPSDSGGSDAV